MSDLDPKQLVRASKFLAKHLRHEPEALGLTLGEGGWVGVDELLRACRAHKMPLTRPQLEQIVEQNDKKRFAFDPTGTRIRANQGHSVDVDLQLAEVVPPAVLYHGTGHNSASTIWEQGLKKMARHHVHLSDDLETARKVGGRHGRPVVFQVDAARLHDAGHTFYRSENGVYLTDAIPPAYLSLAPGS